MQQSSQPPPGSPAIARFDNVATLRKIADGDVASLGSLFDQMAHPVYSSAMQLLRNHDEAEDVVESTLWQVWLEAAQLVDNPDPRSWLLNTGRRRALDRLRSRRRQREEHLLDKRQLSDLVATFAEEPGSSDSRTGFLSALQNLAPEERQILELGYFRGLSQADISELTGDSAGEIRARMRSALHKLCEGQSTDAVEE